MKKMKKTNKYVIEVGEFEEHEEEMVKIKWRNFKVHHLIAIRGEMNKEFSKHQINKINFKSKLISKVTYFLPSSLLRA